MKNRFKLMSLLLAMSVAISFNACSDDDDDNNGDDTDNNDSLVLVTENITSDATWTNDKIYQLGGRIAVTNGAKLTIEEGTIIKGEVGTGANASALIVARGAQIDAEGTPEKPIIFTSVADEIDYESIANGDYSSPNLDPDANGLWGGVLILGNAPISVSGSTTAQIEGIPSSDTNGQYGGDDPEDSSGIFKYVSIRHGGANIGEGNEINGLSLGGVGNKTVIENIEIIANQDDGIEFFGGTVSVKNVVVWNVGDDGLDTDQGWNGTCENFVVISPAGHVFELDGIEGDKSDQSVIEEYGYHTFKNGYVIANTEDASSKDLANLDPETNVHFINVFFNYINEGQTLNLQDKEDDNGDVIAVYSMPDDFLAGVTTSFENVVLNVTDVTAYIDGTMDGITAGTEPAIPGDIDLSVFDGWTWSENSIVAW
ncbi:hypothetical protein [Thermophagus xiamenensis]|uniref:Right handed beta helix region n=1 Tax=Thermophagus xiamenensis TaxID=385682 RepID=A0A1I1ZNF5_9BACT|nr:hypothetical protein [Thermophagus xiamenensis]SFE31890.1 hypothetical protein SAMN05444380_109125 [Thermophagus xiamenensis]